MAISVVMPALEMAQETGKVLAWRKKEGERVSKGEPLLEIETDKAVVEIESPGDGLLAGITANVGAVIPVGETIAWLVAPGEKPPLKSAAVVPAARASSGPGHQVSAVAGASRKQIETAPQISPKARRLANELGIEISKIRGTGPNGTISTEDVQAFANAKNAPAPSGVEPLSQVARLMAERTMQGWTSVPHFFLVRDVDAGALVERQQQLNPEIEKTHGVRLTITDLLVALVPEINMCMAIAVKDGVVGAVIPKADSTKLGEISTQRHALTQRARAGRLRPADIGGGTFTLSNLGMYKVDAFSAIITPPQAAMLAVGTIADRVVPVDGKPGIRPMMTITLSSDHRVVDGARAAEFLGELADAIREPENWLQSCKT
jgi:pyruvate dehydrogenase E2 component (dihydrolipoamide acetyltransferase)